MERIETFKAPGWNWLDNIHTTYIKLGHVCTMLLSHDGAESIEFLLAMSYKRLVSVMFMRLR